MQLNAKNIFSLAFLIVALSFAYYFVIFLPNKHKAEQELEKEKFNKELQYKLDLEELKEISLRSCLQTAYETYKNNWDINCPKFALDNKEKDCSLPRYIFEPMEKSYKDDQELCVKKYKD